MGHIVNAKEEVYQMLAERLNKNPVGAPINESLMEIMHRLYTESEASVGSKFPLVPVKLERLAIITGIDKVALKTILDSMAVKGLVLDIPRKETYLYILAPMVIGFFEYTFMRVRNEVNMKELAELFEEYFTSQAVRDELAGLDTKIFRTLAYESLITVATETEVLTYERASEIIRASGGGSLSLCSCRHKALHLGKSCGAPLDVCTSLGNGAKWIIHRGLGKPATVTELLRVLDQTEELGLVHLCDNVLNQPTFICHCCGCCCLVLKSISKSAKLFTHPSNFIPELDEDKCTGCSNCADSCHIKAITMKDDINGNKVPEITKDMCIGCGVCASSCPDGALKMSRRSILHIPPENSMEKFNRIAKEKGRS